MFEWLRSLFAPETTVPSIPEAPVPATALAQPPAAPAANDATFDLVGNANRVMAKALSKLLVKRTAPGAAAELMPVLSVSLGGMAAQDGIIRVGGSATNENVTLTVQLKDAVGNYDIDALNNAVHAMLCAIPALHNKVKFAKDVKDLALTHEDVWKKSRPTLEASGKFTKEDLAQLDQYFIASKDRGAESGDWRGMHADHDEGKVQMRVPMAYDAKVADPKISGEMQIVNFFNEHKDDLLKAMKKKVAALNILSATDLEQLDCKAAIMKGDWGSTPTVEFGTKGEPLGKTALASVDTDKLSACFTEAFLEMNGGQQLPAIFGLVADGPMVGKVIAHRLGHTPQVKAILDHEMFKDRAARRETDKKDTRIEIGNAPETNEPNKLQLSFYLPHGVSLTELRQSVVQHAHEIGVKAEQKLQSAVGRAA